MSAAAPDAAPAPAFSARVRRRYELYWRRRRFSLHTRGVCQLTYLDRDRPLADWHCCPFWQRKLSNKWNSREFALKLGCAVPQLYWSGTAVDQLPFGDLPDRYVVRVVVGHSRKGVLVLDRGVDLLTGERHDVASLRLEIRRRARGLPRRRILVEEFVPPEPGSTARIPRDYKCYVFGDRIGAIQVMERGPQGFKVDAFDADWNRLPHLHRTNVAADVEPLPPACLEEIRSVARTLGSAFGSFVRVDLYAGPQGALFGEFTSTPSKGLGWTDFADRHLGDLWQLVFPQRI